MEHLFTYGTLRPGGRNADLLELGLAAKPQYEAATAAGMAIYASRSGAFPYAVAHPALSVHGTLVGFSATQWAAARPHLDALEGFDPRRPEHGHYVRRRWSVRTGCGRQVLAWVYLAGPRTLVDTDRLIPGGDWLDRPLSATRFLRPA